MNVTMVLTTIIFLNSSPPRGFIGAKNMHWLREELMHPIGSLSREWASFLFSLFLLF